MFRAMCGVVPRGSGYRDDFGKRIAPRLSGFRLDGIQNPVAAVQNAIMKTPDDAGAFRERDVFPSALGFASPESRFLNIGARCKLYLTYNFAGGRISNFDNVSPVDREL